MNRYKYVHIYTTKEKTKLRISAFVVKRNQKLAQVLVEPGPLNLQQDNNM